MASAAEAGFNVSEKANRSAEKTSIQALNIDHFNMTIPLPFRLERFQVKH
jgi:hypothetical protein